MLKSDRYYQQVYDFLKTFTIKSDWLVEYYRRVYNQMYGFEPDHDPGLLNPYYRRTAGIYTENDHIIAASNDLNNQTYITLEYFQRNPANHTMFKLPNQQFTTTEQRFWSVRDLLKSIVYPVTVTEEDKEEVRNQLEGTTYRSRVITYAENPPHDTSSSPSLQSRISAAGGRIADITYRDIPIESFQDHPQIPAGWAPVDTVSYEKLIERIARVKKVAEAPDMSLLAFDETLLEEWERNDIVHAVYEFLHYFKTRWMVHEFTGEDLYGPALWATLWYNLIQVIHTKRIQNVRTPRVHSYHIWEYLRSMGLGSYEYWLTREQALYLYNNLRYLIENRGKTRTFKQISDNLLEPNGVEALTRLMLTDTSDAVEDCRKDPQFVAVSIGGDVKPRQYFRPEYNTLSDILERENISDLEPLDHQPSIRDEQEEILTHTPWTKHYTKLVEFDRIPRYAGFEELYIEFYLSTLLHEWYAGRLDTIVKELIIPYYPTEDIIQADITDLIYLMIFIGIQMKDDSINLFNQPLPTEFQCMKALRTPLLAEPAKFDIHFKREPVLYTCDGDQAVDNDFLVLVSINGIQEGFLVDDGISGISPDTYVTSVDTDSNTIYLNNKLTEAIPSGTEVTVYSGDKYARAYPSNEDNESVYSKVEESMYLEPVNGINEDVYVVDLSFGEYNGNSFAEFYFSIDPGVEAWTVVEEVQIGEIYPDYPEIGTPVVADGYEHSYYLRIPDGTDLTGDVPGKDIVPGMKVEGPGVRSNTLLWQIHRTETGEDDLLILTSPLIQDVTGGVYKFANFPEISSEQIPEEYTWFYYPEPKDRTVTEPSADPPDGQDYLIIDDVTDLQVNDRIDDSVTGIAEDTKIIAIDPHQNKITLSNPLEAFIDQDTVIAMPHGLRRIDIDLDRYVNYEETYGSDIYPFLPRNYEMADTAQYKFYRSIEELTDEIERRFENLVVHIVNARGQGNSLYYKAFADFIDNLMVSYTIYNPPREGVRTFGDWLDTRPGIKELVNAHNNAGEDDERITWYNFGDQIVKRIVPIRRSQWVGQGALSTPEYNKMVELVTKLTSYNIAFLDQKEEINAYWRETAYMGYYPANSTMYMTSHLPVVLWSTNDRPWLEQEFSTESHLALKGIPDLFTSRIEFYDGTDSDPEVHEFSREYLFEKDVADSQSNVSDDPDNYLE